MTKGKKTYILDWKKGMMYDPNEIERFDWHNYNVSQMKEKSLFIKLLDELCSLVEDKYCGTGRRPASLKHQVFCICLKTYLGTSSRRVISDIELSKRNPIHFNTILNYFNNKSVFHTLNYLISLSALPLSQIEDKFAIDSTGFSEHKYLPRWNLIRQKYSQHRLYKKAHCIYGTYSNIISSVIITHGKASDSPYFNQLLQNASANFKISEVSADMAYSSRKNLKFADSLGISPFIPFKKNTRGRSMGAIIWHKTFEFFRKHKEEFMEHYHLRSNCESGFFMIKQKFGDSVSCKNTLAQTNEILAKILCHNICVLIQEIFLSGVEVDFDSCAKRYVATN